MKKIAGNPCVIVSSALASLLPFAPGSTQQAVAAEKNVSVMMEEIVVVSRKRASAERLQDVPVAATVFGRSKMEAIFAEDLEDLGDLSPNVEVENAGTRSGVANIFIRGMGATGSVPTDEPTVGIIQDGVFWGVNYGGLLDSYDLESVEILRGPQGTLFGRNVTAGAFNIRSARPSGEFGYGAKLTVGNYDRRDVAGFLEAPILDDKLAVRVALQRKQREGFVENLNTGNDNFGDVETTMIRGVLEFTPTENLDVTFIAEDYSVSGDAAATYLFNDPGRRKFTTQQGIEGENEGDVSFGMLEANLNLGHGLLTSITGYRTVDTEDLVDIDAADAPIFSQLTRLEDQEQVSQEIRYASTFSDRYEFTIGAYYFDQSWDFTEQRNSIVNVNTKAKLDHSSMAIFADVDYNLTDKLVLNLGGRFTKEEKTAATAAFGPPLAPGAAVTPGFCDPDADIIMNCIFGPEESEEWTNFAPKLSLSYSLNQDSLVYGLLTRGFRSGGFAMRGSPLAPAYDEEIVDAFELGYKADFFDQRLRVNGAIFYNQYDDLQRTVVDPVTILQATLNAAEATIVGLELEVVAMLTDSLVLNFNYGYTDASYDAFDNFDIDGDGTVDPEAVDLDFARVPENQYTVALTHEGKIGGLGTLMSRVSYSYTDERALDDNNFITVPSFENLMASIRFMDPSGRWSAALFGKNLTDEEVFTWGLNVLGGLAWGGAPRTWGVELAYDF